MVRDAPSNHSDAPDRCIPGHQRGACCWIAVSSSSSAVIVAAAVATVLVAMLQVVAGQTVLPNSCTSLSSTLAVGACATGSASAGSQTTVSITVKASDFNSVNGDQIVFLVWNKEQTTVGWSTLTASTTFQVQTPAGTTQPISTTITGSNVVSTGNTPTSLLVGAYTKITACAGIYQVQINAPNSGSNLDVGVFAVIVPNPANIMPIALKLSSNTAVAGGDSDASFTKVLLPPGTSTGNWGPSFQVLDDWAIGQGKVSSFTVFIKPTSSIAAVDKAGWSVSLTGATASGGAATKTVTSNGYLQFTWTGVAATSSQVLVGVSAPVLTPSTNNFPLGYSVKDFGPLFGFTFAMGYAVQYDDITSGTKTYTLDATTTSFTVRVPVDPLWWKVDLTQVVTDVKAPTSTVTNTNIQPTVSFNNIGATWSLSPTGQTIYNTQLFNPALAYGATYNSLSAAVPAYQGVMYLTFSSGGCDGTSLSVSLSAKASVAQGTCRSYADCSLSKNPNKDQEKLSANGDSSRFSTCRVVIDPSVTGYGNFAPKTACVECAADTDCLEGQFCYTDKGVCSLGGTTAAKSWICDAWAAQQVGYCVVKNTNVLGSKCRTATAQVYATGTTPYATSLGNLPLVQNNVGANVNAGMEEDQDGYFFCGEARFFNDSVIYPTGTTMSAGQPRAILWTGSCVNGICMECTPARAVAFGTGRQCINGRMLDSLYVDFTTRTYTKNTVAGTLLGGLFMIILLQICVCANMFVSWRTAKSA